MLKVAALWMPAICDRAFAAGTRCTGAGGEGEGDVSHQLRVSGVVMG